MGQPPTTDVGRPTDRLTTLRRKSALLRMSDATPTRLRRARLCRVRDALAQRGLRQADAKAMALHRAMMAYHESYARDPRASDIEPLLAAVRLPGALGLANPEIFARLIELLHARGGSRLKAGRSGAYLERWKNPQMAAALMAEIGFAVWRVMNRKQQPPRYERDAIVDKVIEQMPAYKRLSEGGKEDFREGVHEKLRKSKTTRLDVPESALEGMVDNAVKKATEDKKLGKNEQEALRKQLRRLLRL
jgi:hypothetical protein